MNTGIQFFDSLNPTSLEAWATVFFVIALLHTFLASQFNRWANLFPEGSFFENLFHLLGEVEVVFGVWAGVFLIVLASTLGGAEAIAYTETLQMNEPLFVFAIMTIASTRPILVTAERGITGISRLFPFQATLSLYITALSVGPLLGSLITEPAAMTVTAWILRDRFFSSSASDRMKYGTLALLFVNVSIGGVLTHFAAPPVLMVAGTWGWDTPFMFQHFGWKAILAVCLNTALVTAFLKKDILALSAPLNDTKKNSRKTPVALTFLHLLAMAGVVLTAHHPILFMGILLFFLGLVSITQEYQDEVQLKSSLLVGFFLAGLVFLGGPQKWWLAPLLSQLDPLQLMSGATVLTALTDNAALTFLGAQIPHLSEAAQYALVAGAVTGGGLTVIANAPNPAGYAILQDRFGVSGVSARKLLLAALVPTGIAYIAFWFL